MRMPGGARAEHGHQVLHGIGLAHQQAAPFGVEQGLVQAIALNFGHFGQMDAHQRFIRRIAGHDVQRAVLQQRRVRQQLAQQQTVPFGKRAIAGLRRKPGLSVQAGQRQHVLHLVVAALQRLGDGDQRLA